MEEMVFLCAVTWSWESEVTDSSLFGADDLWKYSAVSFNHTTAFYLRLSWKTNFVSVENFSQLSQNGKPKKRKRKNMCSQVLSPLEWAWYQLATNTSFI